MPYSKAELIAAANEFAREHGFPQASESVFESWINKKLVAGARPRGFRRGVNPEWTYPDSTLAAVKLILELESLGARRTAQIMICLWIFGSEFPHKRIVAALKSELRRIIKRQERGPPWFHDHYLDLAKLSKAERSRRVSQLPALDPDLAASGIAPTAGEFLAVALRVYWGAEDDRKCASSTTSSPDFSVLANLLGIDGAIGPPEQSATGGYEALDRVTPEELEQVRTILLACAITLHLPAMIFDCVPTLKESRLAVAFAKAARSFLTPEWIVPTAALFSISALNGRHANDESPQASNPPKKWLYF
ncbi:MAG: hypothetical protein WB760_08095 [Xanthobacteraceae bacterium]